MIACLNGRFLEEAEIHISPEDRGFLFADDEIMIVGTTMEITPVASVNGRRLRSTAPGEITRRLWGAFKEKV